MYIPLKDNTIGKTMYNRKLENELKRFIINMDSGLNYEYADTSNNKLVFITGKSESEKDLPIFQYPYVIEYRDNVNYIFTDLRQFIKTVDEDLTNLSDIIKDKSGFDFTVNRTLFTYLQLEKEGELNEVGNSVVIAFGKWLSNIISLNFKLTPIEEMTIQIVAMHYYLSIVYDDLDEDSINNRVSKFIKMGGNIVKNNDFVTNVMKNLTKSPDSALDLVDNFNNCLQSDSIKNMNVNILLTMLSTSWYGVNNNVNIGLALEDSSTFTAMMYSCATDKNYKRAIMTKILEGNNRAIELKKSSKILENIIKEQII